MRLFPLSLISLTIVTALGFQAATALEARAAAGEEPAKVELYAAQGAFQVAQSLFVVEQLEEIYQVPQQANVYQRPDERSETIEIIPGNSAIRVTGRITGTPWYRVWTNNQVVGYLTADRLGPPASSQSIGGKAPAPGPSPAQRPQVAALTTGLPAGVFQDCQGCPQMVALPPGKFSMGSAKGDPSEQPAREVTIDYDFAVGRFEVTVAEWQACVAAGACSSQPDPVQKPAAVAMRNISWGDAQQFVGWLRQQTGKPYRLLSEAEWEYAARAGTGTAFWWGNRAGSAEADCKDCGGPWDRKQPTAIGRFDPNPFGLHDMNGGVAEWTADCWFDDYQGAGAKAKARDRENCQQRVLRGGSWKQVAEHLRSTARHYYDALVPYNGNGLRVALTLN